MPGLSGAEDEDGVDVAVRVAVAVASEPVTVLVMMTSGGFVLGVSMIAVLVGRGVNVKVGGFDVRRGKGVLVAFLVPGKMMMGLSESVGALEVSFEEAVDAPLIAVMEKPVCRVLVISAFGADGVESKSSVESGSVVPSGATVESVGIAEEIPGSVAMKRYL